MFMPKKKVSSKEKRGKENSIPLGWFVLTVVIAVLFSIIVTLIIINLSMPASALRTSTDTGTIVVQIVPDTDKQSGIINVEIKETEVNNSE